jgi:urease accessory protein
MRKVKTSTTIATGIAAALIPSAASAHTGAGETLGFFHGFGHPIGGMDHVLAMVLVGLLAWQLGGRALWMVPATFVLLMAAGGGLGMAGANVPMVETGIALSIVVLGLAVALRVKAPVLAIAPLVGLFAIFHGHAHGAEMPENAGGLAYGLGFMVATAMLHAAGIGVGFGLARLSGPNEAALAGRIAGGAAAAAGLVLFAGSL